MRILDHVKSIQRKAKEVGNYRFVAKQSGVGYEWLSKFSRGLYPNPTVENVAKLEAYFLDNENFSDCHCCKNNDVKSNANFVHR